MVDAMHPPLSAVQKKETLLKKRLRQLDYGDYDYDDRSASLVSRLLTDLMSATDAARQFRKELDESQREAAVLNDQVQLLYSPQSLNNTKYHIRTDQTPSQRNQTRRQRKQSTTY